MLICEKCIAKGDGEGPSGSGTVESSAGESRAATGADGDGGSRKSVGRHAAHEWNWCDRQFVDSRLRELESLLSAHLQLLNEHPPDERSPATAHSNRVSADTLLLESRIRHVNNASEVQRAAIKSAFEAIKRTLERREVPFDYFSKF